MSISGKTFGGVLRGPLSSEVYDEAKRRLAGVGVSPTPV